MAVTRHTARKTKASTIASLTRKRTFTLDVDHEFLAQLIESGSEDTRADWIRLESLLKKPRRVPSDLIPELLERTRMEIECYRWGPDRTAEDEGEEMHNVARLLYSVCEWAGLTGKLDMTKDPTIAADEARRGKEREEAKIRREEYERKEWETRRNQVKTA